MAIAPTSSCSLSIGTDEQRAGAADVGQLDERAITPQVSRLRRNVGDVYDLLVVRKAAQRNVRSRSK